MSLPIEIWSLIISYLTQPKDICTFESLSRFHQYISYQYITHITCPSLYKRFHACRRKVCISPTSWGCTIESQFPPITSSITLHNEIYRLPPYSWLNRHINLIKVDYPIIIKSRPNWVERLRNFMHSNEDISFRLSKLQQGIICYDGPLEELLSKSYKNMMLCRYEKSEICEILYIDGDHVYYHYPKTLLKTISFLIDKCQILSLFMVCLCNSDDIAKLATMFKKVNITYYDYISGQVIPEIENVVIVRGY